MRIFSVPRLSAKLTGLLLTALSLSSPSPVLAQKPEFRAVWVDAWHPGFKSSAECDQLLANARAAGINAIVVQMRRRGDTYYPSPHEPWASDANPNFDALAYLIQKAHSGTPRLDVYCWFVMYPVASAIPSDPNHPYNKYPEWIMKDASGNTRYDNNSWFDPGVPEVEDYLYRVVMDVVARYDIDGISLDYIRYPGDTWGYNEIAIRRFNALYGCTGVPNYLDEAFMQFRRDNVTALVRKIYVNAIAVKPHLVISACTIGWGNGPTYEDGWYATSAYRKVFQDWRAWMQEGILDLNTPMFYYDCTSQQWTWFTNWLCYALDHKYARECAIGVSFCDNDAGCIASEINAVRNPPCASSASSYGYLGYSYACQNLSLLQSLNGTTVNRPDMPWKTNPTRGHLKGHVTRGGAGWMDGATVTVAGPVSRTTKTDGTGFYAFIDLPPGIYTVTATKTGYGSKTASPNPEIAAGEVTTCDIDFPEALTISNVQAGNETGDRFTVTWTTNIPSTSQVYYGPDPRCANQTTEDTNLTTNHSVTITGLQPLTGYYYKVISRTTNPPAIAESSVYAWATGVTRYEYIIDNPQATFVGSWSTASSATDKYGADYSYTSGAVQGKSATWTPNIARAGNYRVYVWYPQGSNRYSASPYTVYYSGGSRTYTVNQTTSGGQWNLLGTHPFETGTSGRITLTNQGVPSDKIVVADAVRFEEVLETTPPSVPQSLQAVALSESEIRLSWNASTDNVGVAGYRVYRNGACIATTSANTTVFTDTSLKPNTGYTYSVSAFDTAGNKSSNSPSITRYTLCKAPNSETVVCSKAAGIWHSSNPFVFNAVDGFGPGRVYYYQIAWDTEPTHVWTGLEESWLYGPLTLEATSGSRPYYLHIRGYNQEGVPCAPSDLGPYYLDDTAPATPIVQDDGDYTSVADELRATWTTADPESGIQKYEYAVGTSPGYSDVISWTDVSDSDIHISMPEQNAGTTLYISVRACNYAGIWSNVGHSDGITVGAPIESCARAKDYPDGVVVILRGRIVTAVFDDCFYVADPARLSGIRVESSECNVAVGDIVDVGGKLSCLGGERSLTNARVLVSR